jgi:hypothetical protein
MQTHTDPNEAFRDSCAARVDEEEVFLYYGDLPESMKRQFMQALQAGDTDENDRQAGRVMRAAFNRAVDAAEAMRVEELKREH